MKHEVAGRFAGPNLHAPYAAIVVNLEPEDAEVRQRPLEPAVADDLASLLADLPDIAFDDSEWRLTLPSISEGGALNVCQLLRTISVRLLNLAANKRHQSLLLPIRGRRDMNLVLQCDESDNATEAVNLASEMAVELPAGWSADNRDKFAPRITDYLNRSRRRGLHYYVRPIVRLAEGRGIPWRQLPASHFVRFGQGVLQRDLFETMSERTGAVALAISRDKVLSNRLLKYQGLPTPLQFEVKNSNEAVRAAAQIGGPVVVKPADQGKGAGVEANLSAPEDINRAYAISRRYSARVIVEKFISGNDHRLLVIEGRLVAAAQRIPARITGDGENTIEHLIARLNRDPLRGNLDWQALKTVKIDRALERHLKRTDHSLTSIPDKNDRIWLSQLANMRYGATAVDVLPQIHPDNRELAIHAASVIGLPVAGVDFLTPDISQSFRAVECAINEVNGVPSIRPHLASGADPADIAGPIIDGLYPAGANGRIPIVAVFRHPGSDEFIRFLSAILARMGQRTATVAAGVAKLAGKSRPGKFRDDSDRIRQMLGDRRVEIAVFELDTHLIADDGLPFDQCDVAVVGKSDTGYQPAELSALQVLLRAASRACVIAGAATENALRAAAHVTRVELNDEVVAHNDQDSLSASASVDLLTRVSDEASSYPGSIALAAAILHALGRDHQAILAAVRRKP